MWVIYNISDMILAVHGRQARMAGYIDLYLGLSLLPKHLRLELFERSIADILFISLERWASMGEVKENIPRALLPTCPPSFPSQIT
jgi:hypothetical protein